MTRFEKKLYKATEEICIDYRRTHSCDAAQNFRDICWGITALNYYQYVSNDFYDKWSKDYSADWQESADY